jgi:hypothetical protein
MKSANIIVSNETEGRMYGNKKYSTYILQKSNYAYHIRQLTQPHPNNPKQTCHSTTFPEPCHTLRHANSAARIAT